jgi:hypothetical protein
MGVKVTNNAFGILASAITNVSTTITLSSGDGAKFPVLASGDFFFGTLINTANQLEIVKVTARSTNTLTVIRGQDGTTARAYSAGDRFELRPTAAMFEAFTQAESISYDNTASGLSGNTVQTAIDSSKTLIDTKQATLVSGTNIKTINSTSLLGSGNIVLTTSGTLIGAQYFTSSGTYTKATNNPSFIIVEVVGGGSAGTRTAASNSGGTSSFGAFCSATGGIAQTNLVAGVGGQGSGGDVNLKGGGGTMGSGTNSPQVRGAGGCSVFGGGANASSGIVAGAPNTGGGGNGGSISSGKTTANSGNGGGAGGYSRKQIDAASLGASESVTVGAGGATSFSQNGAGGSGIVIVWEYK